MASLTTTTYAGRHVGRHEVPVHEPNGYVDVVHNHVDVVYNHVNVVYNHVGWLQGCFDATPRRVRNAREHVDGLETCVDVSVTASDGSMACVDGPMACVDGVVRYDVRGALRASGGALCDRTRAEPEHAR